MRVLFVGGVWLWLVMICLKDIICDCGERGSGIILVLFDFCLFEFFFLFDDGLWDLWVFVFLKLFLGIDVLVCDCFCWMFFVIELV